MEFTIISILEPVIDWIMGNIPALGILLVIAWCAWKFMNHLDGKFDALDNKISALDNKMDSKINALEARIDNKINALEARIDNKINALEARIDKRFDAIDRRLDVIEKRIHEHDIHLERIDNTEYLQKRIV